MKTAAPAERPSIVLGMLTAAAGGAIGGLLRLLVGTLAPVAGGSFPWSTFAINVVGAGLLALLPVWPLLRRRPWIPVFLGTGVLGGFTTMSTASAETFTLLSDGHGGLAAAYVAGTMGGALLLVILADRLVPPSARAEFALEGGDE